VLAVAPDMPNERLVSLGQAVRVRTTADFVAMIQDQRSRARCGREPGRDAMKISGTKVISGEGRAITGN
jgi:hypothetical protein